MLPIQYRLNKQTRSPTVRRLKTETTQINDVANTSPGFEQYSKITLKKFETLPLCRCVTPPGRTRAVYGFEWRFAGRSFLALEITTASMLTSLSL